MSNRLTTKAKMTRSIVAAVLAMLFAGSAVCVLASAMQAQVPAAGLYFAAALAAALSVLGAASGTGAAIAAGGFVLLATVYAGTHSAGLGALRALFASWAGAEAEAGEVALGARTLLTMGTFVLGALFYALLNRRELVMMAILLMLSVLVV